MRCHGLSGRTRGKKTLLKIIRDERGVAGIEMALVTPFLVLGLLLMVDVGIAIGERLDLDHSTRTGAQAVMANLNDTMQISSLMLASTRAPEDVTVSVEKTCACGGTTVECTSWCSAEEPPSVFMNISAARLHDGFLLPPFNVESRTHVQIR